MLQEPAAGDAPAAQRVVALVHQAEVARRAVGARGAPVAQPAGGGGPVPAGGGPRCRGTGSARPSFIVSASSRGSAALMRRTASSGNRSRSPQPSVRRFVSGEENSLIR